MPRVLLARAGRPPVYRDVESLDEYDALMAGHKIREGATSWPTLEIVRRLDAHRQRTTYEARAGCDRGDARVRGWPGERYHPSPLFSWVVNATTGLPSGDYEGQIHAEVAAQQAEHGMAGVIVQVAILRDWLQTHFVDPAGNPIPPAA